MGNATHEERVIEDQGASRCNRSHSFHLRGRPFLSSMHSQSIDVFGILLQRPYKCLHTNLANKIAAALPCEQSKALHLPHLSGRASVSTTLHNSLTRNACKVMSPVDSAGSGKGCWGRAGQTDAPIGSIARRINARPSIIFHQSRSVDRPRFRASSFMAGGT